MTIFLFLTSLSFASEDEKMGEVWVDGDSFYKAIPHKKKSTIYFKEWTPYAQQFFKDNAYYVALQLDRSFDPLPADDVQMPSLTSIAAIASDSLLASYLTLFEQFGRTQGINYMVLPDTSSMAVLEKEVIAKAIQKSPYYFLPRSLLNHSIPESKKDFEEEMGEKPTIWITSQDENLSKMQRWSSKYLEQDQFEFFKALKEARDIEFFPSYSMHENIREQLFLATTTAIDKHTILPLSDEVISYLGSDLLLRQWLSRYAHVIDYPIEGVRSVIDMRGSQEIDPPIVKEGDILLSSELVKDHLNITQLLVYSSVQNQQNLLSRMLFGSQAIIGQHQHGRSVSNYRYLGYSSPDLEGMDEKYLDTIDTLARHAISRYATPGMQVAVVRNGNQVWKKNFGFYTYDSIKQVNDETLYDVASMTKVMATLPAIALLMDRGLVSLDDSISQYLPAFRQSNKSGITIRQLLAHNGGLRSYIPFWSMMMSGDRLDAFYYKTEEDEKLDRRSYGLEPDPILLDTLKSFIVQSELIRNPTNYNYSDLGFMVLHLIVEAVTKTSFEAFLTHEFYGPMGLRRTVFNPKEKGFTIEEIAPTEYDSRYRNYQVWGEVHDRNSLVFGGVAGHAGLFSTASDMAKMMSMLNGGYYGGRQYLSEEVLDQFNFRHFDKNRRGLGWDKKDGKKDSASQYASDKSFGHTGFTGTMVWADPDKDLIFVFLSNRIYPDAENWRLGQLNTRTQMHDRIYESIKSDD